MLRLLIALPLLLSLTACPGGEPAKGDETPMPAADGKSDTWWAPTLHGELRWGELDQGDFDGAAGTRKFHAWDFTLTGAAESAVVLTTEPIDLNVDTVAYLYRWDEAAGSYGSYLARNDDHGGSIGSQISRSLGAGDYRVIIKGYKDTVQGSFSMLGTCEGAGCPAAITPNGLSAGEESLLVQSIDNLCGDTFCGGDFNWWTASIACVWGTGCTVTFDAKSYYEEDAFPVGWLDQFSADQLTATGTTSDGAGPYLVTVEKLVDRASDGLWARASCELAVPYAGFAELHDGSSASRSPEDAFWGQLMDCVSGIESVLFVILPTAVHP